MLPYEIWSQILQSLPLSDLSACRLVCRMWNAVVVDDVRRRGRAALSSEKGCLLLIISKVNPPKPGLPITIGSRESRYHSGVSFRWHLALCEGVTIFTETREAGGVATLTLPSDVCRAHLIIPDILQTDRTGNQKQCYFHCLFLNNNVADVRTSLYMWHRFVEFHHLRLSGIYALELEDEEQYLKYIGSQQRGLGLGARLPKIREFDLSISGHHAHCGRCLECKNPICRCLHLDLKNNSWICKLVALESRS
jgi:hypothetical protein